jgi:hypothetical protein
LAQKPMGRGAKLRWIIWRGATTVSWFSRV